MLEQYEKSKREGKLLEKENEFDEMLEHYERNQIKSFWQDFDNFDIEKQKKVIPFNNINIILKERYPDLHVDYYQGKVIKFTISNERYYVVEIYELAKFLKEKNLINDFMIAIEIGSNQNNIIPIVLKINSKGMKLRVSVYDLQNEKEIRYLALLQGHLRCAYKCIFNFKYEFPYYIRKEIDDFYVKLYEKIQTSDKFRDKFLKIVDFDYCNECMKKCGH